MTAPWAKLDQGCERDQAAMRRWIRTAIRRKMRAEKQAEHHVIAVLGLIQSSKERLWSG